MSQDLIDEREFELVNIIGKKLGSSQRDLSRLMDLSLGQTNMLVRRLVSKGLIRISQLDGQKVKYLLTPKGIAEKMRKSVKYTLNTINSLGLIKNRIKVFLNELYEKGERQFYIVGKSDLVTLVEMSFGELEITDCFIQRMNEMIDRPLQGLILICEENFDINQNHGNRYINLVEELAKDEAFDFKNQENKNLDLAVE